MLTLGLTLLGVAGFPYAVYLAGMTFGKKLQRSPNLTTFIPITIVISAYNEVSNIEMRLFNIKHCNYPNVRIIFIDDCSTDKTADEAMYWLGQLNFNATVIRNEERLGPSRSYNKGIRLAETDIVITTDADVMFRADTLGVLLARLVSEPTIGAVCGELESYQLHGTVVSLERSYRSFYGRMCEWESAHDSTFNFNGALVAIKRSAVNVIEERSGADDANTAFAAIRNGYRAIYEPRAYVSERVPETFKVQYRQKIRRAIGLLSSIISNRDLLHVKRPFRWFYALRIWMMTVSPIFYLIGAPITLIALLWYPLTFIGVAFCIGLWWSFVSSFTLNQLYLVIGLLNVRKNVKSWQSTSSHG